MGPRHLTALCLLTFAFSGGRDHGLQTATPPQAQPGLCGTVGSAFGDDHCLRMSFQGEVSAGQTYEQGLGANLLFRLKQNEVGWYIEVLPNPRSSTNAEFIWVVTPPYRFGNARYVDTSYGVSAKEAVKWTPRDFNFVLDEQEYKRAGELVDLVLWSRPPSDQKSKEEIEKQSDEAAKALSRFPVAKGQLFILDSKVGTYAKTGEPGSIEWTKFTFGTIDWIKFRVELRVPCDFAPVSDSKIKIDRSACPAVKEEKAN